MAEVDNHVSMHEAETSNVLPEDEELFAQGDLKDAGAQPEVGAGTPVDERIHTIGLESDLHVALWRQRSDLEVETQH